MVVQEIKPREFRETGVDVVPVDGLVTLGVAIAPRPPCRMTVSDSGVVLTVPRNGLSFLGSVEYLGPAAAKQGLATMAVTKVGEDVTVKFSPDVKKEQVEAFVRTVEHDMYEAIANCPL